MGRVRDPLVFRRHALGRQEFLGEQRGAPSGTVRPTFLRTFEPGCRRQFPRLAGRLDTFPRDDGSRLGSRVFG